MQNQRKEKNRHLETVDLMLGKDSHAHHQVIDDHALAVTKDLNDLLVIKSENQVDQRNLVTLKSREKVKMLADLKNHQEENSLN